MNIKYFFLTLLVLITTSAASSDVYDISNASKDIESTRYYKELDIGDFTSSFTDDILETVTSISQNSKQISIDSFMDKAREQPELVAQYKAERNTEGKVLVFVSMSMPEAELLSLFKHASLRPNVYIHFQGLMPGDKIPDFFKRVAVLANGLSPEPNILLDPVLFRKYGLNKVPVIARKDGGDSYSNILYGSVNTDYFNELLEQDPDKKDFGVVGQLYDIAEPNLIDEMKSRAANVDWEAQKKGAIDNFWKKFGFVDRLPVAREKNTFLWDPTLYLTEDVKGDDDVVIAKKGTMYSPFDFGGFSRRIFVFDPTSPEQFERVLALSLNKIQGLTDVFLATRMDRVKGWNFLQEIQTKLKSNVYLIDGAGLSRLRVQRVPSSIVPSGRYMKVTEHPIGVINDED